MSSLAVRAKRSTGSIGGACVIPLVHVRICTCPLKLLHGVTDSICSVRADRPVARLCVGGVQSML